MAVIILNIHEKELFKNKKFHFDMVFLEIISIVTTQQWIENQEGYIVIN